MLTALQVQYYQVSLKGHYLVLLFYIQFNDIFYITDESGLYNFADDNNLSAIGDTVEQAKSTLKQQTTNVLKWFDESRLIANPKKFNHKCS